MVDPKYSLEFIKYTNQATNIISFMSLITLFLVYFFIIDLILKYQKISYTKIILFSLILLVLSFIIFRPFYLSFINEILTNSLLGPPVSFTTYFSSFFSFFLFLNLLNPLAYLSFVIFLITARLIYKKILKIDPPPKIKTFLISILALPYLISGSAVIFSNLYKIAFPFLGQKF